MSSDFKSSSGIRETPEELRAVLEDFHRVQEAVYTSSIQDDSTINKTVPSLAKDLDQAATLGQNVLELKTFIEKYNLQGVLTASHEWLISSDIYLYGRTAINALVDNKDHVMVRDPNVAYYSGYSNQARFKAQDFGKWLYQHGIRGIVVASSLVHPHVFRVTVNGFVLMDLQTVSTNLLRLIDFYPDATGVKYCGPLWLRMNLYQELAALKSGIRWQEAFHCLKLLNEYAPIESYDLKECVIWTDQEMFEDEFEEYVQNDSLHQDLYKGIVEFIAQRKLVVFGASADGWESFGLQNNESEDQDTFITTRSRMNDPEYCLLSIDANKDANALVVHLQQFLYQDDTNIEFKVIEKPPQWVFEGSSYAVVMTETLFQKDGSVRAMQDTLVELYDTKPTDHHFAYHIKEGVSMANLSSLTSLLALQYYCPPPVHLRNRVILLIERLIYYESNNQVDPTTAVSFGLHDTDEQHEEDWIRRNTQVMDRIKQKQKQDMTFFRFRPQ